MQQIRSDRGRERLGEVVGVAVHERPSDHRIACFVAEAGHVTNIIPEKAVVEFECRAFTLPEFEALLQGRDPATVVHHCGSGVSAVPNVLAMQIAGLGPTALYAGSWSEWSNTPGLPTRQGAQA